MASCQCLSCINPELHTKEITLSVQALTPGTPQSGFASPSGAFGISELIKASALRPCIKALQRPAAMRLWPCQYATLQHHELLSLRGCLHRLSLPKPATVQCASLLQLPSLLNNVDVKGLIGSASLPPVIAMLTLH